MADMILPNSAQLLSFRQRSPDRRLQPWVQCLWSLSGNQRGRYSTEKLYPDAGASLTISLESPRPVITLCFNRRTLLETLDYPAPRLGVRFKAAGTYCLLGLSPEAFTDIYYELNTGSQPAEIAGLIPVVEQLYPLDAVQGINVLEAWLLRLLDRQPAIQSRLPLLTDTISKLQLSPQQLGAQLGFTRRTLERKLKREVGASPGQLVAFARLQHARHALIETTQPLADIALNCGYYDQAHFTRAFQSLALETPNAYRQRKLSQIYKA
ncbi:AraC family transcriptional regulator [Vreelandella songnenensis]|uniref:AraC family transcriptional regulator n=1 Tax=Vreelandella songnenensis TaxID=1176243 RepID=A0A2T0V1H4_9GAMM|nr:helix-turn-helix transcriptional regulator [Halomonas songnenensis]PRY64016.1 AraC family transcriptional regulator [Halomonas songnenensis]